LKQLFKEVQIDKVTDKIVDQLENLIKEGQIAPGDKLPSERKLIEMLGVGRSSLREALNKLEVMGYVEIKKRKGIFVKSIDSALQLDPLKRIIMQDKNSIVQLYEIRSDIEQSSAYEAAGKGDAADLEEIEKCLRDFDSSKGERHFTWERDLAFHVSIARASHNFFRIHVIMNMFDISKEFIQPIMEGFADKEENAVAVAEQHAALFEAIRDRRAEDARERMREHLDWTNRKVVEYFEKAGDLPG
jgi:GntR family transcriptional repressor for pyruvate dehydrogenase complex